MKAAILREVGKPLEIEEIEIDKPGSREVLIRTAAAGGRCQRRAGGNLGGAQTAKNSFTEKATH